MQTNQNDKITVGIFILLVENKLLMLFFHYNRSKFPSLTVNYSMSGGLTVNWY
jgi:hypothetical protein